MKKIILAILAISLLILTACESEEKPKTGGAFIGGTQGIVASFEPLSIKEDNIYAIFDAEEFSLDMLIKNKGEENLPIGKATLRLLGPAQNDFQGIPAWELKNREEVEKISEFNPEGGEEIVAFSPQANAIYKGQVTGFMDINWNLEYEYEYKTHLIVNDVCFKGDITDQKVCAVKESKLFSVSSAPITVTAAEEDTAGKGIILLKITISNAGAGDSTIVGQKFDNRFNQVAYSISEPEKWECKSGGRVNEARLVDNMAQIICKLKTPLNENDIYTKSLRLTFDYLYKELITEKLRVKESVR